MTARRVMLPVQFGKWHMKTITAPQEFTKANKIKEWLESELPECVYGMVFLDYDFTEPPAVNNTFCSAIVENNIQTNSAVRYRNGVYSYVPAWNGSYDLMIAEGATLTLAWLEKE